MQTLLARPANLQPTQPWTPPLLTPHLVVADSVHPNLARGVGRHQPLPGIPASSRGSSAAQRHTLVSRCTPRGAAPPPLAAEAAAGRQSRGARSPAGLVAIGVRKVARQNDAVGGIEVKVIQGAAGRQGADGRQAGKLGAVITKYRLMAAGNAELLSAYKPCTDIGTPCLCRLTLPPPVAHTPDRVLALPQVANEAQAVG